MLARFLAWLIPPKHDWLLTESDGHKSLQLSRCSEDAALDYLRAHFANASIDHIDREWHVIFYRQGRSAPISH